MENLVRLLSIAAAGCFVLSAAFLLGLLRGFHHSEIAWYLTFNDFVNYAPAMLVIWGVFAASWIFNDAKIRSAGRRASETAKGRKRSTIVLLTLFGALLAGGIFAAIYFHASSSDLSIFLVIMTIGILVTVHVVPKIQSTYGQFAADAVDSFAISLNLCIAFGYGFGSAMLNGAAKYDVCFQDAKLRVNYSMPIERGLIVFQGEAATLLPWPVVKSVVLSSEQAAAKSGGKC
jgi:hypothetical protein